MDRKTVEDGLEQVQDIALHMQTQMSRSHADMSGSAGMKGRRQEEDHTISFNGVTFPAAPPLNMVIKRPSVIKDGKLHIDDGNGSYVIVPAPSTERLFEHAEQGIVDAMHANGWSIRDLKLKDLEQRLFTGGFDRSFGHAQSFSRQGYVASLPQILSLRAQDSGKSPCWSPYIVANSEEIAAYAHDGPRAGHFVVINIHGGGIITSSKTEDMKKFNSRKGCAIGIGQKYINMLLERGKNDMYGTLPNGDRITVYDYNEFLEESANKDFVVKNPRFAVIRDLGHACVRTTEIIDPRRPYDNSTFLARAGGAEMTIDYVRAAAGMDYRVNVENLMPKFSGSHAMGYVLCIKDNGSSSLEAYKLSSNEAPFLGLRPKHKADR